MKPAVDPMSPSASPSTLADKSGVRRLNGRPAFIILALAVCVVFVLVAICLQEPEPAAMEAPAIGSAQQSSRNFADDIVRNHTAGITAPDIAVASNEPRTAAPPTRNGTHVAFEASEVPPRPRAPQARRSGTIESRGLADPAARNEAEELLRAARTEAYLEALKSGTTVGGDQAPRNDESGDASDAQQRLAAVHRRLNALDNQGSAAAFEEKLAYARGELGANAKTGFTEGKPQDSYQQFARAGAGDRWRLDSRMEEPPSPYLLRAGFVLPATLMTGINSELSGQITAQVSRNVYDSPTGHHLLVPQGAQLVGTYGTDIAHGQNRILVAWQRINFPDGRSLDIGAMPGADEAGQTGFHDGVNNHLLRLYGSALLMSGVTAGVALSQGNQAVGGGLAAPNAGSVLSAAVGQQLGQATAQLLSKNMNIAPTLEVRPGYDFHVVVTKDLVFSKPY